jgi:phytoene desaturase
VEIKRLAGDQGIQNYTRYRAYCEQMFKLAYEDLADQPMHAITTTLRAVPAMARLQCYRSVYSQARRFFHDSRLQQAFSIQPLLLGGNPLSTTALYHLIHALEQRWGVHFAMGGTGAIVRGLTSLMSDVGIEVITGQSVHSIAHDGRRAHKVICDDGTCHACDMIVSNTDPDHLYDDLLQHKPKAPRPNKHSFSLYLLYFGTDCQYPDIAHHTILMGADYERELKNLFGRQHFDPDNFSIYLHRPTATDPAMAPAGCDSFYALVAVPNLKSTINWDNQAGQLREAVINRLEARLLHGLRANLVTELALDPRYFRDSLLSHYGAAFSVAPLFYQSGYFRYHNKVPGMDNIYLAGAGTHPGAGIPGVLNSAKVVEKLAGSPV